MATIFLICWLPWFILMLLFKVNDNVEELELPAHVFVLVRRDFNNALKSLFKTSNINRSRNLSWSMFTKETKHNEPTARLTDEMAEDVV
ncbi:hypothetical protein OS493_027708 [Desmophyllum pertusum]|uniref:Uncharacterized protein n=1 Tax=Desmophyllum pertusum TaxID=174260 RepID=A0A9W9Z9X0_9CNID|nr:hypothetical protein OS493_027708 [Desmophyllum pertusum]